MPTDFDPYESWFQIPASEQPPDFYRLLGVERFENDPTKIAEAGDRRTQFLQDLSTGKNVEQAQRLLNEVARAMVCLSNPAKKLAYDDQLRRVNVRVGAQPSVEKTSAKKSSIRDGEPPSNNKSTSRTPNKTHKTFPLWTTLISVPVLAAVVFGVTQFWGNEQNAPTADSSSEEESSTGEVLQSVSSSEASKGVAITEDFSNFRGGEKSFNVSSGQWALGESVLINSTKEKGIDFLHLTGGVERTAVWELSPKVTRVGLVTIQIRRWSTYKDEFDFQLESSSDGKSWKSIPEATYSGKPPKGTLSDQPWSMIFELDQPTMNFLRLTATTPENRNGGGLLIDRIIIEPIAE